MQIVEVAEDSREEQIQVVRDQIAEMPPALKEQIGHWLLERRNAWLRAEREEVEAPVQVQYPQDPTPPRRTSPLID